MAAATLDGCEGIVRITRRLFRALSERRKARCPDCFCREIDFIEHAQGGQRWSLFRCPDCGLDHWLPF